MIQFTLFYEEEASTLEPKARNLDKQQCNVPTGHNGPHAVHLVDQDIRLGVVVMER